MFLPCSNGDALAAPKYELKRPDHRHGRPDSSPHLRDPADDPSDRRGRRGREAGLAHNEHIKIASGFLRGTLADGLLKHATGAISEDDGQLVKFHGMYLQDDRDLRPERTKKKLDKAYSFMIRLRIAGGVVTPKQWLVLDNIATTYANGTLRATTRQTFQYHGVIKSNLKRTMAAIDAALLDTIAACGDVNRNVMASTNPAQSGAHKAAYDLGKAISDTLLPKTNAWREIWLDGEKVIGGEPEFEPVYGKTYLPRKFKIVIAVPPSNEVDVFAHDLGFIAILDKKNEVTGWNVTVGGGMGMTHGEPDTFPRTADVMLFCKPDEAVRVAEAVMTVPARLGQPQEPQERPSEIHDRALRPRGLPRRGGEALRQAPLRPETLHLHGERRPLRLDRG